ncbi:MAG TPA: hypothetical protein P5059_02600 [Candidatus Dojkabacteria bacterium]|nr:hypothetical protein [Candidatus Dojkabacteria bacterium]
MLKDILLLILSLIFPQKEVVYVKDHMILTNHTPSYIYWIDDSNVLLSSYGYTLIYNTNNRKSNVIDTCEKCIYGYDFGLFYCSFKHRDIDSMEEFSSTIYQYNAKGELIFKKDIFETVVPLVCKKDYIVLETGDPVLEQNTYLLNTKENSYERYVKDFKEEEIKGIDSKYLSLSKSRDQEKIIVLDEYKRLWVYMREK